jgi:hypothetical protein
MPTAKRINPETGMPYPPGRPRKRDGVASPMAVECYEYRDKMVLLKKLLLMRIGEGHLSTVVTRLLDIAKGDDARAALAAIDLLFSHILPRNDYKIEVNELKVNADQAAALVCEKLGITPVPPVAQNERPDVDEDEAKDEVENGV